MGGDLPEEPQGPRLVSPLLMGTGEVEGTPGELNRLRYATSQQIGLAHIAHPQRLTAQDPHCGTSLLRLLQQRQGDDQRVGPLATDARIGAGPRAEPAGDPGGQLSNTGRGECEEHLPQTRILASRAKTLGKGSVKIWRGPRDSWQKKRRARTTSGTCDRPQSTSQGVGR
jgi:hypothetical protein